MKRPVVELAARPQSHHVVRTRRSVALGLDAEAQGRFVVYLTLPMAIAVLVTGAIGFGRRASWLEWLDGLAAVRILTLATVVP
jgi:hypothetical protein